MVKQKRRINGFSKENKRGLGIARRLYEPLEEISVAQHILNLNACIAYADTEDAYLTNDSVTFHSHMGYAMVGKFHQCGYKFGKWYDMVWMEKMIDEHPADPAPVMLFPSAPFSNCIHFLRSPEFPYTRRLREAMRWHR